MRVGLSMKGDPYGAKQTRIFLSELRSRVADSIPLPGEFGQQELGEGDANAKIVHPFLGFDALSTQTQMSDDRSEDVEKDHARFRILVVGGSVSGVFTRLGTERLTELLRADPVLAGHEIEYLGYGRGGYKQPQQIIRLVHLLTSGIRPDLVLNLDGFNEVAIGNQNRVRGVYPTYPSFYHWMRFVRAMSSETSVHELFRAAKGERDALVARIDSALERDWFASALWGHFQRASIVRQRQGVRVARTAYLRELDGQTVAPGALGPDFEGDAAAAIEVCLRSWKESSRQMDALCELYGIDYLHVLQPTLHDPGAKRVSREEREKGDINANWREGVEIGYPLLRSHGRELAREGIDFLDASLVFEAVEETLYYDACHFNRKGNRILAEAIAPALLRLLAE